MYSYSCNISYRWKNFVELIKPGIEKPAYAELYVYEFDQDICVSA